MVMRVGGLASGMDIDELVKKLMTAERAPLDKLFQKKTTYEWQREAYRSVNTKLKTFDTYLSKNLSIKPLNSKTATSSNSNLVSAKATGKASGTLSIEGVSQLAKAARSVGEQINATGSTKMSSIASGIIEFKAINANGKMPADTTKIEITADMTVNDFVKKVNESNAGVSAVFENGRFSFTAKNTGKGNVEITGNVSEMKLKSEAGQNAIFQVNGIATERASNSFEMNGYNVTLKDTFNSTQTISDKYKAALTELKNAKNADFTDLANKVTDATGAYNTAKSAYESEYNKVFSNTELTKEQQEAYNKIKNPNLLKKLSTGDTGDLAAIRGSSPDISSDVAFADWLKKAPSTEVSDDLKAKLSGVSREQFTTLKTLSDDDLNKMQNEAKLKEYETIGAGFLNGLKSGEVTKIKSLLGKSEKDFNAEIASLKESTDEADQALGKKLGALSSNQKQALRQLESDQLDSYKTVAEAEVDKDSKLKLKNTAEANETAAINRRTNAEETFVKAEADAKAAGIFKLDSNNVEEIDGNGYKIIDDAKVNAAPKAPPITITSTTNVDDMMKTITDFVDTYNALVKDFTDQTKESKYRDYKPLSAEQKKDMSENEIKLWEEKAKSGLLRSDSLIRNGLTDMRSLVYQTNPGLSDSKFNSLFNIGITTSKKYNEGGTLEIDVDKLRKAIEEDPDAVEKLFKNSGGKKDDVVDGKVVDTRGYVDKLRESMKSFEISIEKKAGRSTMTDSEYSIGKSLKDTETRIKTWERKLEMVEARYWKQFSAMESAINKANSQSSMFMQQG
ncbi:flagellar filament capping protein FliD [Lysinibacillus sp. NPDC097287]|uniref:flagellar filament capping protein FliD n=1 Tax=Lysinibacillus sp. NPDC097287 TaxID=3364144 RepID=UPI003826CAFE